MSGRLERYLAACRAAWEAYLAEHPDTRLSLEVLEEYFRAQHEAADYRFADPERSRDAELRRTHFLKKIPREVLADVRRRLREAKG